MELWHWGLKVLRVPIKTGTRTQHKRLQPLEMDGILFLPASLLPPGAICFHEEGRALWPLEPRRGRQIQTVLPCRVSQAQIWLAWWVSITFNTLVESDIFNLKLTCSPYSVTVFRWWHSGPQRRGITVWVGGLAPKWDLQTSLFSPNKNMYKKHSSRGNSHSWICLNSLRRDQILNNKPQFYLKSQWEINSVASTKWVCKEPLSIFAPDFGSPWLRLNLNWKWTLPN